MPSSRVLAPSSRDKILEAAEALFARRGFSGVGLSQVAEAAGLGKSSLFHHFESKLQLYFEVLERVLGRIEQRLGPALAAAGGPRQRLEGWVDALIDALAEHPTSARLLLRGLVEEDDFPEAPLPEAQRAERRLAEILHGIHALLRDGIERGAFRKVSVPHTVQTLIGATVYHFASGEVGESILGRPLLSAEAVRRRKQELRQLVHHGLAASGAV
jgi:TetR/AcrR family transcriptional regulator